MFIKFVKKHTWMVALDTISLFVIVLYIATSSLPEVFVGAELIFNLLYQLSVGFLINTLFFIMQIYIVEVTKERKAFKIITPDLKELLYTLNELNMYLSSFVTINEDDSITYSRETIYYKHINNGNNSFTYINLPTYFSKLENKVKKKLEPITSNMSFPLSEQELVCLISNIQCSNLFYLLGNTKVNMPMITAYGGLYISYMEFRETLLELNKYFNTGYNQRFEELSDQEKHEYFKKREEFYKSNPDILPDIKNPPINDCTSIHFGDMRVDFEDYCV